MAYYYVKNGGTATGDAGRATTKRTGSFATMGATAYYDSIYDVFAGAIPTTTPISGDFTLVSSTHNKDHTAGSVGLGLTDGTTALSVDDSTAEDYKNGASESTSAASGNLTVAALGVGAIIVLKGISLQSSNNLIISSTSITQKITIIDSTLGITTSSSSDYISTVTHDNQKVILENVILDFAHVSQRLSMISGETIWNKGSIGGAGINTLITNASIGSNTLGATLSNLDLTNLNTAVSAHLATSSGFTLAVNSCLLGSGVVLDSTTSPVTTNGAVIGRSIGFGTATDTKHYFKEHYYSGTIEEAESVYRDAGASYEGTNNFSAEIVSNANAGERCPVSFEFPCFYVDTADYKTDITFTVHFAVDGATTVLNSDEFYMEVTHKDGADNALGGVVSTKPEPLTAGVAPTTETGLWTIGATNKQMSISKTITIGTATGNIATGPIEVKVYLAKASQTMYACPKAELS